MNNTRDVVRLEPSVAAVMRTGLTATATEVVAAIVAEVPDYRDAFAGPMGATIQQSVELALDGFLELAGRGVEPSGQRAIATVVEGAYRLGQGETRAGRTMEALLAAYRVGARVAWRSLSGRGVRAGLSADRVAVFAELVFAYIDQLSAASAAGHADELETSGRVRQRLLERVAGQLLGGSPDATVDATARRAEWTAPTTLTAVVLPAGQVRGTLPALSAGTLVAVEDLPGVDEPDTAVLLVPDVHRGTLLRTLEARATGPVTVGPTVDWRSALMSYRRALRARDLVAASGSSPGLVDADTVLPRLVLTGDPDAYADLQRRALAPMGELRPAAAEKLTETLRAWLLCRGRRDEVAALLHVHPQTVRYRVGQLRELFGERLDDPEQVLELVLALGTVPA